jgi:ABC-2 type transport system ATP-binding protein
MQDSIVIQTYRLTKYYHSYLGLQSLDLTIRQGEIFGYLGPNGAGKTTTIRLLLGLLKPTGGNFSLLGKGIVSHPKEYFHEIGYIPGNISLYNDLTGNQYLSHFWNLRKGKNDTSNRQRLNILKEKFNIDYDKKIGAYSKGMKQVIGIIQAFMHQPRLLILDEPTSGLDPIMQELFYKLLLEERKNRNTIFFSSHILSEVERVCDRVGIIKKGKLVCIEELGNNSSLIGKKVTLATASKDFLSIMQQLKGVKELTENGNKVEFFYSGELNPLMQHLASIDLTDFTCESPSIEDVFFKFYKE